MWKTFNEITAKKSNSTITSIEADVVLYTDINEIVQALNTPFSRIGPKLAAKIKDKLRLITSNSRTFFLPAFWRLNGNDKSFFFCSITESFVLKQLKSLKTNKAIGLDRISARLLKESAECMAPVLTRFFDRSLETSIFPSIWKCGKVTALFKGGDRTDCNNYRPITVLPTISKILERAVHQQMYEFLSANKLLTPNQFGFRPKLSTVTALAHFRTTFYRVLIEAASLKQFF